MFPSRFFPDRFFAPRYFPKVGTAAIIVAGPYYFQAAAWFAPGCEVGAVYQGGAEAGELYGPGAEAGTIETQ